LMTLVYKIMMCLNSVLEVNLFCAGGKWEIKSVEVARQSRNLSELPKVHKSYALHSFSENVLETFDNYVL
jgi:hypothetical protein